MSPETDFAALDTAMLARLADAPGWVLDVDGCLVRTAKAGGAGGMPIGGAADLIGWLKAQGKSVVICTNASQRPAARYAAHLREIGLDVGDDDIVTAATAAAHHIRQAHGAGPVVALGDVGLIEALAAERIVHAGPDTGPAAAVIVGAADSYSTDEINAACLAVADHGAALYVTVDTEWFHGGKGKSVCASTAIARAIRGITGAEYTTCGKPSAVLADVLRARVAPNGEDMVIVGDMAPIECRMAREMGALGVLVLSGGTRAEEVPALPPGHRPHLAAADVGALWQALKNI